MSESEVKCLEEFIKQQIEQEIVNRLDVYGKEIIFLLHKISCYLPYLATPSAIGKLEKEKDQILAFIGQRTDETIDIIRERLSMLSDVHHEDSHENETVLSPEQSEEVQQEVNNSYICEAADPKYDFLKNYNIEIPVKEDK